MNEMGNNALLTDAYHSALRAAPGAVKHGLYTSASEVEPVSSMMLMAMCRARRRGVLPQY